MKRTPLLVTAAAALVLVMTGGCGVEEPAAVVETADSPAGISSEGPADPAPETPEVPPTAAVGDTVSVGAWDVRVLDVALDANSAIAEANEFNETAAGRYLLVTYEATYTGPDRIGDSLIDLTWSFTTTDAQVNEQSYVVTPADDAPTEARQGGTITGDVAFDLPPELVTGGTLTVESYDDDFDLVYADFRL